MKKALVISIHDVSPKTYQTVERMLLDLKKEGVERSSLLVIPNHHHIGELSLFPKFVSWLQEKEAQGHEIVLHGLFHRRPPRQGEGFLERWITRSYTAGEGEFFDLSYPEAVEKLRAGRRSLEEIGFSKKEVVGFIAPAWLLGTAAQKGVQEEGFVYTTRLGGVWDLRSVSPTPYPSQSMVYSVRAGWRRGMSLVWNECLFQWILWKKKPLLRMSLHPPDWEYPRIRLHALKSLQKALLHRTPMTYYEWVKAVTV